MEQKLCAAGAEVGSSWLRDNSDLEPGRGRGGTERRFNAACVWTIAPEVCVMMKDV